MPLPQQVILVKSPKNETYPLDQTPINGLTSNYPNHVALRSSFGTESHTVIMFDCDDKSKTKSPEYFLKQLSREFGPEIKDTLIIKTPTGGGIHVYTQVPTDIVKGSGQKLKDICVTQDTKIEVFVFKKDSRQGVPIPGTKKNDIEYTFYNDAPIINASSSIQSFIKTNIKERVERFNNEVEEINLQTPGLKEDAQINIEGAELHILRYAKKFKDPTKKIQQNNRDQSVYEIACELSKFYLSISKAIAIFEENIHNNSTYTIDKYEDELVEKCFTSAWRDKEEKQRLKLKAFSEIFAPMKRDEEGRLILSKSLVEDRAEYFSKNGYYFPEGANELINGFCETLYRGQGYILVPKKDLPEYFNKMFSKELKRDIVDLIHLKQEESRTHLYFESYSTKMFDESFRFVRGTRQSPSISRHNAFVRISPNRILDSKTHNKNIIEDSVYYSHTTSHDILTTEQMSVESNQIKYNSMMKFFRNALTAEEYPEEFNFLLDRLATLFQKPDELCPNFPIFFNEKQGIGKSYFTNIIAALTKPEDLAIYTDIEQLIEAFIPPNHLTIIDEGIDFNNNKVKGKIRSLITNPNQFEQQKYIQGKQIHRIINMIGSTNFEIEDVTILNERRITVFHSETPPSKLEAQKEVAKIAKFLLGTASEPFLGLKFFYTRLMQRDVIRKNWEFHTNYQKKKLYKSYVSNPYYVSFINWFVNGGMTPFGLRYCLNDKEINDFHSTDGSLNLEHFDMAKDEIVLSRPDHVALFSKYYIDMEKKVFRNDRQGRALERWFKSNDILYEMYRQSIDLGRNVTSRLVLGKPQKWTTLMPSIETMAKELDSALIDTFSLHEFVKFFKTAPSIEEFKVFFGEQYPNIEPGTLNYMQLLEDEL